MIEIALAADGDREEWDRYVDRKNLSFHAHCWAWKEIITGSFRHKAHYLIARRDGGVTGILPLIEVRSVLFGRALISLPYINGGGVVADDSDTFRALLTRAESLLKDINGAYLELRHREANDWLASANGSSIQVRSHKVAMLLPLLSDPEGLLGRFPAKLRSQIRRPTKDGVYAEVYSPGGGSTKPEDRTRALQVFYAVFAENMRDLGTPVYPKKFFELAELHFGKKLRIVSAWFEGRPVAAAVTIGHGTNVEVPWASSLRNYNKLSPNMLVYWEAISKGCFDGYQTFDFGRSSPDSGTFRFKEQWGSAPLLLHWYYILGNGQIPDVNPKSNKFSVLVGCWKRLPLPVANILGPWVTRSLP